MGSTSGVSKSKITFLSMMVVFLTLLSINAYAFDIVIDPNGYPSRWLVGGKWHEPQKEVVDLAEGIHNISVAAGDSFQVSVDNIGNIESLLPCAATGTGNVLKFLPTTIKVNTNNIAGWHLVSYGPRVQGDGSLVLLPGLKYLFSVAYGANFHINLDETGNVSSENLVAATGAGKSLTLNATTLNVNTKGVEGWHLLAYGPKVDQVTGTLRVVPGLSYIYSPAYGANIHIAVDDFGNVTSEAPVSATGSANTLTLHPIQAQVDTSGITGWHRFNYGPRVDQDDGSVWIIPGLRYIYSPMRTTGPQIWVELDDNGNFTSEMPVAAEGVGNTLRLKPQRLIVETDNSTDTWRLHYGPAGGPGGGEVSVMLGLWYTFIVNGEEVVLEIDENYNVSPNQVDIGGGRYSFKCEPAGVDSDTDGVFNQDDNCPAIANPDQADSDIDGLGDVCDFCINDVENDLDADGFCESDDNCPTTSNSDQLDSDLDENGDVCDEDDDNDIVLDSADNCPLRMNTDQADFDNDGSGDVCDQDDDNDGLVDSNDQCQQTLSGEVTNANGCSIADLCACESQWKNHGAYMKCIAHTSNDFVGMSLITAELKDNIVSEAAQSSCGAKR